MSNDESIESMARERLAGPGVVDREPVLRRYDRLQHPLPTSALADRLQQRAAHGERVDGNALVWQRTAIASSSPVPEPPPSADVGHATTPSVEPPPPSPDIGHATTPSMREPPPAQPLVSAAARAGTTAAPSFVQRLAQRQHAPGAIAVADRIMRATSESAAITADSVSRQVQARYGVEKAAPVPALRTAVATMAASRPVVVMRQADPTISRRAQHTPLASIINDSSNPARAEVAALRSVTRPTSLPISIARKHEAPDSRPNSIPGFPARSAPVAALARSAPSAATSLVLRRVAAPEPASPSAPPVPYAMPSSSAVAEELTRAAHAGGTVSASHAAAAAATQGGHGDIDRIAEEVERRLRLRLEIERERRGIRSWR